MMERPAFAMRILRFSGRLPATYPFMQVVLAFWIMILSPSPSAAQDTTRQAVRDSLQLVGYDTSGHPRVPIPLVGSVERTLPDASVLSDSEIRFIDYRRLGDLLSTFGGVFVQEFGAPGEWDQLFIDGLDGRNVQFALDGVPLNDSYTGLFNLLFVPTEHIGRIEFIRGATAFAYGLNSTGGLINIVTPGRRAIRPISRIRYSESAYGEAFIDGLVSQDILRGLNVTAGGHHKTYGGRFLNSDYDQWNGRLKLRYNLSNSVDLVASEDYNQTFLDLFGGISLTTPDSLRYDQTLAGIVNGDSYEKVTRHDLLLQAAITGPQDSLAVTTISASYSSQLREYRDEENRPGANGIYVHDDQYARWLGIRVDHQRTIGDQSITAGAEIRTLRYGVSYKPTERALFGVATFRFPPRSRLTLSGRLESFLGHSVAGVGADGAFSPLDGMELFGGASRSHRFPVTEELMPATLLSGGSFDRPEEHDLAEAGIRLRELPAVSLEVRGFNRIIRNYVGISRPNSSPLPPGFAVYPRRTLRGVSLSGSVQVSSILLESHGEYLNADVLDGIADRPPEWSWNGGIYFRDKIAGGHFDVKAGVQARVFSSYFGPEFNEELLMYIPDQGGTSIPASAVFDAILLGHLGDAQIHFLLQNIFDRQYVMNTFYPMVDRSLRFGLTWEFLN